MFGYIVPEKPELKVREFDIYRGYYCGICKQLGAKYGQLSRMTLNYDSVFLAMIIDGLVDNQMVARQEHCFVHPIQKRLMVRENIGIEYAADMHVILAYYKLRDDFLDDCSIKGLLGMGLLRRNVKKLMTKYGTSCEQIKAALEELTGLEKERTVSLDLVSGAFAKLMQAVFSGFAFDEKVDKTLQNFGHHLGKWIYLIDAYDDLDENRQDGSYNPFLMEEMTDHELVKRAEFNLLYHLGQMAECLKELAFFKNKETIENILYLGMLRKTESVLKIKIGEAEACPEKENV